MSIVLEIVLLWSISFTRHFTNFSNRLCVLCECVLCELHSSLHSGIPLSLPLPRLVETRPFILMVFQRHIWWTWTIIHLRNAIYLCLFAYENIHTACTIDQMDREKTKRRKNLPIHRYKNILYTVTILFFDSVCVCLFYRKSTFFLHSIIYLFAREEVPMRKK